jgi:hypothetical protein
MRQSSALRRGRRPRISAANTGKLSKIALADVILFLDDDAEAHRDWLERFSAFYADPSIGGVGGRYINYFHGVRQYPPAADVAGKLYWYGRFVGNMYKDFKPGIRYLLIA